MIRRLVLGAIVALTATAALAQGTGLGGFGPPAAAPIGRPAGAPVSGATGGTAAASPAADETDAITESLKHWLTLVDRWQFGDSWGEAGVLLKSRITEHDWALKLDPVRRPLGAMVKRVPVDQKYTTAMPGLPDGQYDVVRFKTAFEHKPSAIETVILHKEGSRWRVNGYFVR